MKENIHHLLEKYSRNACTDEELRMLEAWFARIGLEREGNIPSDESIERMFLQIRRSARFQEPLSSATVRGRTRRLFTTISIAAMLLLVCGLTVYMTKQQTLSESSPMAEISPGGNKAFLTLSTGKKIALNETITGTVAQQQGVDIVKNADGTIVYSIKATDQKKTAAGGYNTIETPKGGQYQVTLPDGSSVWLNASSSLTFPVHFSPTERKVKVTGEVYFDVVAQYHGTGKNKRVPFLVETSTQTIEVLGTQFNVHDYPEEPASITLVEGKVKLVRRDNGDQILLKPGQQAETNGQTRVVQADLEKALAWKNGDFIFKKEKLSNILKQVSRWYDIEIMCPEHLAQKEFSGMVSRKRPLSSIITMIESTGTVKVTLKDRRAIVTE